MFSIPSFSKLFVLVIIIAAVWYGFRFLGEIDKARRQAAKRMSQTHRERRADVAKVEDTVKCAICGAYVPSRQPTRCARARCPY
jgi:hypothetical protein